MPPRGIAPPAPPCPGPASDLSQQPVLGIKEILRTGSCEPVRTGRIPSLTLLLQYLVEADRRGVRCTDRH